MKTPITAGLYALPGEPLMLLYIERNPDTEKGWLAYVVHEVFLRRDSRQGGTQVRVDRNLHRLPVPVTIELWMTLERFVPKWEVHPNVAKLPSGGREVIHGLVTDEQKLRHLSLLVFRLRQIAAPVGPMHSFWDVILDIEAFMKGRPTIVQKTAEEWIVYAGSLLEKTSTLTPDTTCVWQFKSQQCGYAGPDTSCTREFKDCQAKGNAVRFGGRPRSIYDWR